MKKLLLLLLIVPVLAVAQPKQRPGVTYDAVITRVIDGDTVAFQADFLPAPLRKNSVLEFLELTLLKKDSALSVPVKRSVAKQHQHLLKQPLPRLRNDRSCSWTGTNMVVVYWAMFYSTDKVYVKCLLPTGLLVNTTAKPKLLGVIKHPTTKMRTSRIIESI